MSDLRRKFAAIERGEAQSAEELLPAVYEELRQLAAQKLSQEKPGQTLQPTALVHEVWLRLARQEDRHWADRKHFFFASLINKPLRFWGFPAVWPTGSGPMPGPGSWRKCAMNWARPTCQAPPGANR